MLADNNAIADAETSPLDAAPAANGHEPGRQTGRQRPLAGELHRTMQPVRIGRMADNGEAARSAQPAAEVGAALQAIMGQVDGLRHDAADTAGRVDTLSRKIEAMKDSFDVLEAHMSIGLARSISGMIRTEVTAVEEQLAMRNRYRTRYRAATGMAIGLAAAIGIDRYYPFLDKAFDLARL